MTNHPDAWLAPGVVLALLQIFSYLWSRYLQKGREENTAQVPPLKSISMTAAIKSVQNKDDLILESNLQEKLPVK